MLKCVSAGVKTPVVVCSEPASRNELKNSFWKKREIALTRPGRFVTIDFARRERQTQKKNLNN
jgi:hypothetical protein